MSVQPTRNLSLAELDRCGFLRPFTPSAYDHPLVGQVRGAGLMEGVEVAAERAFDPRHKVAARIVQCCLAEGLIVRGLGSGDVLAHSPPLMMTPDDVELIVAGFAKGRGQAVASLRADGIGRG